MKKQKRNLKGSLVNTYRRKPLFITGCVYCGKQILRKTNRKYHACNRCIPHGLQGYVKILKKLDFIYGAKYVDKRLGEMLDDGDIVLHKVVAML